MKRMKSEAMQICFSTRFLANDFTKEVFLNRSVKSYDDDFGDKIQ